MEIFNRISFLSVKPLPVSCMKNSFAAAPVLLWLSCFVVAFLFLWYVVYDRLMLLVILSLINRLIRAFNIWRQDRRSRSQVIFMP